MFLGTYIERDTPDIEEYVIIKGVKETHEAKSKLEDFLKNNKIKTISYGIIPFSTIPIIE